MGYTHCFTLTLTDPRYRAVWPTLLADSRRIIDAVRDHGVVIAGPAGRGWPVLDPTLGIAFNGEAGTDLDGDGFALPAPLADGTVPQSVTRFCKTGRKPYDLAVTAVLLRCRLLAPEAIVLASDGTWGEQWRGGPWLPGTQRRLPGARTLLADLFGPLPAADPLSILPPDAWPPLSDRH